jgi:hypothetical protein
MSRRIAIALAAVAVIVVAAMAVPTAGHAYVISKRCAWWHLEGSDALVIDTADWPEEHGRSKTSCKAARAVGNAYLDASGWFPKRLRAAGKTWRRVGRDSYNGQDRCLDGRPELGGGFWSYKSIEYRAHTRRGDYDVSLEYHWDLDDDTCEAV